jgi:hypothetical protein
LLIGRHPPDTVRPRPYRVAVFGRLVSSRLVVQETAFAFFVLARDFTAVLRFLPRPLVEVSAEERLQVRDPGLLVLGNPYAIQPQPLDYQLLP